jgi:sirohydrochlorin cobaltochelatase
VLLVGHGTRDPVGVAEFLAVAKAAAERLAPRPLEPSFLEIAEPTIARGIARLAQRGARRVTVVPLLLFAAGHAKRDIPALVAEAAAQHGEFPVRHAPPLECHPRVLELSARRFREALTNRSPVEPAETMLVMVGRGSSDAEAAVEMRRFSQLRRELTPVGALETCFVAKQRPTLPEAIDAARSSNFRRIIVQPHLLFTGQLTGDIRREAERVSGKLPDGLPAAISCAGKQWIVPAPLGPEPELIDAIVDLAGDADDSHSGGCGGKNSLKNSSAGATEANTDKVA